MLNKVIIGLGSNIDPEINIKKAIRMLKKRFSVLRESQFVRTDPIGYKDQDDFINGSVYIETDLFLDDVVNILKEIERDLGRQKSDINFGPRSIDLDPVVWNNEVVDQDFYDRDFLRKSVLELIPNFSY